MVHHQGTGRGLVGVRIELAVLVWFQDELDMFIEIPDLVGHGSDEFSLVWGKIRQVLRPFRMLDLRKKLVASTFVEGSNA